MSQDIGKELPDDLFHILFTEDVSQESGRAIVVHTLDQEGWAHPALLSYREIGARDRTTLRVVTYASSSTTANMRANGKATLMFVDERMAYYVKGTAKEVPSNRTDSPPGHATFDVAITHVLSDAPAPHEATARLTSGITYRFTRS